MNRRQLMGSAAATVAVSAFAGGTSLPAPASAAPARTLAKTLARAQAQDRTRGAAARMVLPPTDLVSSDLALHVLRRCTYGPTPQDQAEIRRWGVNSWLERQLAPASIDDSACDALIARFPRTRLSITGVRDAVRAGTLPRNSWEIMYALGQATLARACWSRRQLFEVMADFWSNHLNVTNPFDGGWDNRQAYDRDVIRRYALGKFSDLLRASAVSPSMLFYLDNRSSTKTHPNENYARELMELHTVGVGAGYTEAQVQSAAQLFTGLTVDQNTGLFRYDPALHATGPVRVLGFSHPNSTAVGGQAAAMGFLNYLAMHPATAARIAGKLCLRFVSDTPPSALVSRLARVYLQNGSAIVPVLRALFSSPEFRSSAGAKLRRPMEDLVATVRVLGLRPETITSSNPKGVKGIQGLYWMVTDAGQQPMGWHPPNGYPDVAPAWGTAATALARWNGHLQLAANWWPAELKPPVALRQYLLPVLPGTYGALVDALALRLVGIRLRPAHTAALMTFLGKTPSSVLRSTDPAVGWRFPYLVALILDSPYFSFR